MEMEDLQALMKMRENRDSWRKLARLYQILLISQFLANGILLAVIARGVCGGH